MKTVFKKFVATLLCITVFLTAFASCADPKPPQSEALTLISDGASDYYIIYSEADPDGEWMAKEVQQAVSAVTGVSLKLRTDDNSFDKEIVVGNANRPSADDLKAALNASGDFGIKAYGESFYLNSNSALLTETMVLTFKHMVEEGFENGAVKLNADTAYIFSAAPLEAETGEILTLVSGGKSDYVITCDTQSDACMNAAKFVSECIYEKTGVRIEARDKGEKFDKEIYVGFKDSKQEVYDTYKRMVTKGDYAVCVNNSKLVIMGSSEEYLLSAILSFQKKYLTGTDGKEIAVKQCDNIIGSRIGERYDFAETLSEEEYCKAYQAAFKTYSTYIEDLMENDSRAITDETKADQKLIDALIERLGDSMVFEVGSSSALHCGMIRKLDVNDYSRAAKLISEGKVAVPKEFLEVYYSGSVTADESGYVDLSALCGADANLSYYYNADKKIAVVYPGGVEGFSDLGAKCGDYTNAQYIERMYGFFHSAMVPEPSVNVEQTRVVVEHIEYPHNVPDYKTNYYKTTYSPSITMLNGEIYVSYEISEVCNISDERSTVTKVKKSSDGGATWTEVGEVTGLRWATVFACNGKIYVLGNNLYNNNAMIATFDEDGKAKSENIVADVGGGAPTAVLIKDGRVYKAYGKRTISADVTADLLEKSSWVRSQDITELFTKEWLSSAVGREVTIVPIEPNIVEGKDGGLYVFFRYDALTRLQLVAKLSDDGKTYMIAGQGIIKNFPTSKSKITIRYDKETGKYITISSVHMGGTMSNQRIVLAIAASDSLMFGWEVKEYLLVPRNMVNTIIDGYAHGLQYADFIFDGDDILFVVREAIDYTCSYHDGNYTTFYRLENYKEIVGD